MSLTINDVRRISDLRIDFRLKSAKKLMGELNDILSMVESRSVCRHNRCRSHAYTLSVVFRTSPR